MSGTVFKDCNEI